MTQPEAEPRSPLKKQRTQDGRWAWIRSALDDQVSGAAHADAVTRNFVCNRN